MDFILNKAAEILTQRAETGPAHMKGYWMDRAAQAQSWLTRIDMIQWETVEPALREWDVLED